MSTIYTATRAKTLGHLLKEEVGSPHFTRVQRTLLAGDGAARAIALGTVMGRRLFGAPAIAPDGGNTGDGALGALTRGDAAKVGIYTMVCIAAAANGGAFAVSDPDGYRLPDAAVGVAYVTPQLSFTIADGAADFVVGDKIEVEVTAGDGKAVRLDPAASDGSQLAAGIAADAVTAPDGVDEPITLLEWGCIVSDAALVWPDGIAAGDKAAAIARLAAAKITIAQGV